MLSLYETEELDFAIANKINLLKKIGTRSAIVVQHLRARQTELITFKFVCYLHDSVRES